MTDTTESLGAGPTGSAPPAFGTTFAGRLLLAVAGALHRRRAALRWHGPPKPSTASGDHPALVGASDAELASLGRRSAGHSIDDVRWAATLAVRKGQPLRFR